MLLSALGPHFWTAFSISDGRVRRRLTRSGTVASTSAVDELFNIKHGNPCFLLSVSNEEIGKTPASRTHDGKRHTGYVSTTACFDLFLMIRPERVFVFVPQPCWRPTDGWTAGQRPVSADSLRVALVTLRWWRRFLQRFHFVLLHVLKLTERTHLLSRSLACTTA